MSKHLITEFGQEEWSKPFNSREWKADEGRVWFKDYDPRYLFRHLGNEEVYYNEQIIRLLQNYRSAYMQLAVHHFMDYQKLAKDQKDDEKGKSLKAKVLLVLDERDDLSIKDRLDYGQSYLVELDEPDIAKSIYETLYNSFNNTERIVQTRGLESAGLSSKSWRQWQNNYSNIVSHLVIAYQKLEMNTEAEAVLTGWLERNPSDRQAKKLLDEL